MNILTDSQFEFIAGKVNKSSILSSEMKEDLIDHFCCAIEEEMHKGMSFEKAYDMAYQNICSNGFDEIQKGTVFLITSKKVIIMKKFMYVSGYLSLIGMSTSAIMKIMHISGGILLFMLSSFIFILLFLPVFFNYLLKHKINNSINDKLKYIFGFLSSVLLILFVLFNMAHWPGAFFFLVSFIAVLNFAFFPMLFFKMYKKS